MEKKPFSDKIVIITGSSKGIGKATAIELCNQGAKVVLNGRNAKNLQKAITELSKKGYNVSGFAGDITNEIDCKKLMQRAVNVYGRIDVLINNGSLTMNAALTDLTPEIFQSVFISNSMGSITPTLAAIPYIKETKGSIIFISSLAGLQGMPSASAYSAGKMTLTAFWQSLRIELSSTGIHFGICFVSFTKNDDEKRMISSGGELVTVPHRPAFIQQTQEKVARSIISMIRRRKAKIVLSPIGKITAFLIRFFPRLVMWITIKSQKNKIQSEVCE